MTSRRGLLASILAAGYAPAAVGSGVLMPVRRIVAHDEWWSHLVMTDVVVPPRGVVTMESIRRAALLAHQRPSFLYEQMTKGRHAR